MNFEVAFTPKEKIYFIKKLQPCYFHKMKIFIYQIYLGLPFN